MAQVRTDASPPQRWRIPAALPAPPGAGEAHVWRASLRPPAAELARLEELLSEDERARAERFRFADQRGGFVVARGVLRTLLGAYLRRDPREIALETGPYGKPYLARGAGDPEMRFNLSHAADLALFAFAPEREVGVDVERTGRAARAAEIAKRYFAPDEAAFLAALPPVARAASFVRLWACKEAYAKATGLGIAGCDLSSFHVVLDGAAGPAFQGLPGWTLHELPAGEAYVAALAVEGPRVRLRLFEWGDGAPGASSEGSSLRPRRA
ncbi:MAG TPA: 4'-phosphopantetheinyl transferase superfamily protein [Longimicrobiaceae bacterium]|nr:4'-phosphopantetheinyl transferase superfamily protein [Longimicrobiaceae bacterium]